MSILATFLAFTVALGAVIGTCLYLESRARSQRVRRDIVERCCRGPK